MQKSARCDGCCGVEVERGGRERGLVQLEYAQATQKCPGLTHPSRRQLAEDQEILIQIQRLSISLGNIK